MPFDYNIQIFEHFCIELCSIVIEFIHCIFKCKLPISFLTRRDMKLNKLSKMVLNNDKNNESIKMEDFLRVVCVCAPKWSGFCEKVANGIEQFFFSWVHWAIVPIRRLIGIWKMFFFFLSLSLCAHNWFENNFLRLFT